MIVEYFSGSIQLKSLPSARRKKARSFRREVKQKHMRWLKSRIVYVKVEKSTRITNVLDSIVNVFAPGCSFYLFILFCREVWIFDDDVFVYLWFNLYITYHNSMERLTHKLPLEESGSTKYLAYRMRMLDFFFKARY